MFSFVGDTVLDPFMGTGTTNLAASLWGRNSIGFDIDPGYVSYAEARLRKEHGHLFGQAHIEVTGTHEHLLAHCTEQSEARSLLA